MLTEQDDKRVLISFDYAIKRLLRNKANYEVLEGFLSELLGRNITVKSIGESESNMEHIDDKYNRVDILVEDKIGEIMLIELQFMPEMDYLHRMLFGTCKAITERMTSGSKYLYVRKVYSINIVYFDLGKGEDYIYHGKTNFMGLHKNDELFLSPSQRQAFGKEKASDIYPEYYVLKVNNFDDEMKDRIDEWIYFFKHNDIKNGFKAKGLGKARKVLKRYKLSPDERRAYDHAANLRRDNDNAIDTSKAEGRLEGIEEGKKVGIKERRKLAKELKEERAEREQERAELAREKAEREQERGEREKLARQNESLQAEIEKLKRKRRG
jgi:predicted transposase/invertase (TIGR01784 family)